MRLGQTAALSRLTGYIFGRGGAAGRILQSSMAIEPTHRNGLKIASRLMIDKVTTVPKSRLGKRIGKLGDKDLVRLNRALTVFLGLASQVMT